MYCVHFIFLINKVIVNTLLQQNMRSLRKQKEMQAMCLLHILYLRHKKQYLGFQEPKKRYLSIDSSIIPPCALSTYYKIKKQKRRKSVIFYLFRSMKTTISWIEAAISSEEELISLNSAKTFFESIFNPSAEFIFSDTISLISLMFSII